MGVLGNNLRQNSVKVVQHKYGNQAGDEFGKACTAAGNAAMTYMNIQSLGAKGLVKKTAKNTGKNIAKNIVGMGSEEKKEVTQKTVKVFQRVKIPSEVSALRNIVPFML